jgi:hypothetical protein
MKTKNPISFIGVSKLVENVLKDEWQSSPVIAAQIIFPPEVIQRKMQSQLLWSKRTGSEEGAKSGLVGQAIRLLIARGVAEKRYINGKKCEYRLATTTSKNEMQE